MGAQLTKSKSLSISGKTKEQQADIITTVENTNNHLDITTNDGSKQTTKNKSKKKKEEKSNKKSIKTKVDKSTNTENCVLPSSSFAEQLVGAQVTAVTNNVSLETSTVQANVIHQSELVNKDAKELQNTCFQNDIISMESNSGNQQNLNEHHNQAIDLNVVEEVANNDQVHCKEQQFVES